MVEKKEHQKKAVIMPYEEYEKLIKNSIKKELEECSFNKFVGILDNNFKIDDEKYEAIVK